MMAWIAVATWLAALTAMVLWLAWRNPPQRDDESNGDEPGSAATADVTRRVWCTTTQPARADLWVPTVPTAPAPLDGIDTLGRRR